MLHGAARDKPRLMLKWGTGQSHTTVDRWNQASVHSVHMEFKLDPDA